MDVDEELRRWFRDTFGHPLPLPVPDGVERVSDSVWTTVAEHRAHPPMKPQFLEGVDRYATIGRWGHGATSWAFYWIEARGPHRCFFRLAFGNAYGDAAEDPANVVEYLQRYGRWRDAFERRLERSEVVHEMGTSQAELVLPGTEVRRLRDVGIASASDPGASRAERWWKRVAEQSA